LKTQQVDFLQSGELSPINTPHTGVDLKFLPEADGLTFQLVGDFITPVPPRTKFPLKITVVAWQFGRGTEPKLQAAEPVERTFHLLAP
jgi:hypothetical protein